MFCYEDEFQGMYGSPAMQSALRLYLPRRDHSSSRFKPNSCCGKKKSCKQPDAKK